MQIPEKPASAEALVEFIAKSARTHYTRTGRGIDGSALAILLRAQYPGLDYVKLGLSKLGDAVRLGEVKGLIKRNPTVKHLEVCPVESEQEKPSQATLQQRRVAPELLYIKPDLWRAAVLSPSERTVMNRETGALASESGPARAATDVDIVPVTEEDQISWLKEFLTSKQIAGIESIEFLRSLLYGRIADFGAPTVRDWKFFRSRKAVEHIRRWADKNKIPESLVLMPANYVARRDKSKLEGSRDTQDEAARRAGALAVIAEMPLEEIEKLAVPLRYVLRHFAK
jgi:hypothetical protein